MAYGNTSLSSTVSNLAQAGNNAEPAEGNGKSAASRAEIWLNRVFVAVFVLVCVQLGIMLVILPWTPVWTQNHFLLRNLALREFAMRDFVRGLVSGLGMVNIWVGMWEGVHYREDHG
jgi:hypothetical protein